MDAASASDQIGTTMDRPPHMAPGDRVVLFDGVCSLCSAWTGFLLEHDKRRALKLCSIQSPVGQDILAWAGLPADEMNTMVYVDDVTAFTESDALLGVVRQLDRPWSFLAIFKIVPRPIRNFFYRRLANNRYRIFGRMDHCFMPTPENRVRFIDQFQRKEA